MTEAHHIDDVDEMRRFAMIRDIIYYELHARRRDGFDTAPIPDQGTNVMQLAEGDQLRTRFRTIVQSPDGTYVVDLAVVFEFPEPAQFSPDAVRVFAGTVAFPIVHPFIRESLRDLASRLGLKRPMLQLLPPEGVELEDPPSPEDEDHG